MKIFGKLKYLHTHTHVYIRRDRHSSTAQTNGEHHRDIWLAYIHFVLGDTIDLRIRVKEVEQWYYDGRGESAILAAYQLSQIGMHHCANSRERRAILLSHAFFFFLRSTIFKHMQIYVRMYTCSVVYVYVCARARIYILMNILFLRRIDICGPHTIRHVQTRPLRVSRLASIPSEIRCWNEINRFELQ